MPTNSLVRIQSYLFLNLTVTKSGLKFITPKLDLPYVKSSWSLMGHSMSAQKMVAKARFRTLIDVHVLPAGSARLILIRVKHAFSKSYLRLEVTTA